MKFFTNHTVRSKATLLMVLTCAISAVAVAISIIILFGSAMQGFNHDENIYCTAGALITSGKTMYKDFAYLHMPLFPVIYAFLFRLFNTTNYLFVGRAFSAACSAVTMLLVMVTFFRAFRDQRISGIVMGTSAAIIYAFDPVIQLAGRFAWNHSLPILCTILSYLIVANFDFSKPFRTQRLLLAGFLAGVAVFTRMSFAFAGLAIFLVLALLVPVPPSRGSRFNKLLVPFFSGVAIPSAVPVYYLFKTPDPFIFDTIQYFLITGSRHWFPGWNATISLKGKLLLCLSVFATPSYLASLILFLFSCALAMAVYRYHSRKNTAFVLAFWLAGAMTVAAFVITPLWVQYFAAPVPFLLVAVAYAVSGSMSVVNKESTRKIILYVSVVLFILGAAMSTVYNGDKIARIKLAFSRKKWVPTRVYVISREISGIIGPSKLILTLAPVFALEGGDRIYPELSTGPFLYRYGRFLSGAQRHTAISTDPGLLPRLLQKRPPDAVLVGFEKVFLEGPLIEYAKRSAWEKRQ